MYGPANPGLACVHALRPGCAEDEHPVGLGACSQPTEQHRSPSIGLDRGGTTAIDEQDSPGPFTGPTAPLAANSPSMAHPKPMGSGLTPPIPPTAAAPTTAAPIHATLGGVTPSNAPPSDAVSADHKSRVASNAATASAPLAGASPPCCVKHQRRARRAFIKKRGPSYGAPIWVCALPAPDGCGFVGWVEGKIIRQRARLARAGGVGLGVADAAVMRVRREVEGLEPRMALAEQGTPTTSHERPACRTRVAREPRSLSRDGSTCQEDPQPDPSTTGKYQPKVSKSVRLLMQDRVKFHKVCKAQKLAKHRQVLLNRLAKLLKGTGHYW